MSIKTMCVATVVAVAIFFTGVKVGALPNPINKPPSYLKLNSVTVKGHTKASAGQALVADGDAGTRWANVEGLDVASQVAGSPATNGAVLTANGQGQAQWVSPPPKFPLDVANKQGEYTILDSESGQTFTNFNEEAGVTIFHLPSADRRLSYEFFESGSRMKIIADGGIADVIRMPDQLTGAQSGYIRSIKFFSSLRIVCFGDGYWSVINTNGEWVLDQ